MLGAFIRQAGRPSPNFGVDQPRSKLRTGTTGCANKGADFADTEGTIQLVELLLSVGDNTPPSAELFTRSGCLSVFGLRFQSEDVI